MQRSFGAQKQAQASGITQVIKPLDERYASFGAATKRRGLLADDQLYGIKLKRVEQFCYKREVCDVGYSS